MPSTTRSEDSRQRRPIGERMVEDEAIQREPRDERRADEERRHTHHAEERSGFFVKRTRKNTVQISSARRMYSRGG